jgi:hypothetical protein
MKGILGYGRYDSDPNYVGCPRAKTDMTPCVARDGRLACADNGVCVGCGEHPADLLLALVHEVTKPVVT